MYHFDYCHYVIVTKQKLGGVMSSINVSSMPQLSKMVDDSFKYCLLRDSDDPSTHSIRVEGITDTFYLHPQRLEEKREFVKNLFSQLAVPQIPKSTFFFCNICLTVDFDYWAAKPICQELIVLAIGLGIISYHCPEKTKIYFICN